MARGLAWVHDRIFAAGGSHIPATWASFQDQMGIAAVVSLNEAHPTKFLGRPPARYLWLAIENETEAGLAARLLAGRFIQESLAEGHRVLLHSSHSRHRTRWVFVAYLLTSGKSVPASIRAAAERPWLGPYDTDEGQWRRMAEQVGAAS